MDNKQVIEQLVSAAEAASPRPVASNWARVSVTTAAHNIIKSFGMGRGIPASSPDQATNGPSRSMWGGTQTSQTASPWQPGQAGQGKAQVSSGGCAPGQSGRQEPAAPTASTTPGGQETMPPPPAPELPSAPPTPQTANREQQDMHVDTAIYTTPATPFSSPASSPSTETSEV